MKYFSGASSVYLLLQMPKSSKIYLYLSFMCWMMLWWPKSKANQFHVLNFGNCRTILVECYTDAVYIYSGAYISKNSTHHFLPDWACLWQKSGQNTITEWSEHKINAIFELSTLEKQCMDTLLNLLCMNFNFLTFLNFLSYLPKIALIGGTTRDCGNIRSCIYL